MLKLDELSELDRNRYETITNIKHELYEYINMNHGTGMVVNVKQNIITLKSNIDIDETFIKNFCQEFDLCLVMKKTVTVENYDVDDYPLGFSRSVKYLFKSSGGIF